MTGAYTALVGKVKAIDAKHGKFEMLLCLGDFFASPDAEATELDDLLNGKIICEFREYLTVPRLRVPGIDNEHWHSPITDVYYTWNSSDTAKSPRALHTERRRAMLESVPTWWANFSAVYSPP